MMFPRDGLPDPGTAAEERDSQSVAGMRRAIEKGAGTSGLIRQCLMLAKNQGLTGEEGYVLLAYQALRRLEVVYRSCDELRRLVGLRTGSSDKPS